MVGSDQLIVGPSVAFDPMVSVSDSRYFGEILNKLESFPKYMPLYNILGLKIGKGLVTAAGTAQDAAKDLVTPVFHFAVLKSAMATIENVDLQSEGLVITHESFKRFTECYHGLRVSTRNQCKIHGKRSAI